MYHDSWVLPSPKQQSVHSFHNVPNQAPGKQHTVRAICHKDCDWQSVLLIIFFLVSLPLSSLKELFPWQLGEVLCSSTLNTLPALSLWPHGPWWSLLLLPLIDYTTPSILSSCSRLLITCPPSVLNSCTLLLITQPLTYSPLALALAHMPSVSSPSALMPCLHGPLCPLLHLVPRYIQCL